MIKEAQFQKLVENYDHSLLEKLAGNLWERFNSYVAKNPGVQLALPLAAGVIGATADVTISAIKDYLAKRNITKVKNEYFEKMLEAHPSLRNEDPELVARYWESLYHFAPNVAADPLAAGAYITQSIRRDYMGQFGGPPIDVYKTLTDIQSRFDSRGNIITPRKQPFLEHYTQTSNFAKSLADLQGAELKRKELDIRKEELALKGKKDSKDK
jgi:hypothetical protein